MGAKVATPSRLSVLLLTDIVGSTDLKTRLGLAEYARRLARHDEIFRSLIAEYPTAETIKDTGDGHFASFGTTSDAVRFALRFQHALRNERWSEPLRARVGIHVGEVAQMEPETTGKPKIVGLAADLVARVTNLAAGGQILLTRFAFNEARQFVSAHPEVDAAGRDGQMELKWIAHGPYLFKGTDEPVDIFEVGAANVAPLIAPTGGGDARRALALGEDETLGWRPAIGLEVPQRPQWHLERRLGEGGFGEVWLARHARIGTHRAFKFCFDVERLRSFKRELTLFRLLHDNLGERPDIARIYEVKLDEPPYFLESEYTEGGNLKDWSDMTGGTDTIPLSTRLDIVSRVADAVAAAHSVGVLHKDIKPSNILIAIENGQPRPQLADFGIGIITEAGRSRQRPVTFTGFTPGDPDAATQTGTRIYVPPEVLAGRPFTMQGDIYALGILLYQMIVSDLDRPLAEGWEREVADELLRQDIADCVDGDPTRRPGNAADLAKRLRSLPARREWKLRNEREARLAQRRQKLGRLALGAAAGLMILLVIAGAFAWRESTLRREAENQREIADSTRAFLADMLMSVFPDTRQGRDVKIVEALDAAAKQLDDPEQSWRPEVEANVRQALGSSYRVLGEAKLGEPHNRRAVELMEKVKGGEDPETLRFRAEWAKTLGEAGEWERAAAMLGEAVRSLERIEGADSPGVLGYTDGWINVLLELHRLDEAEPLLRRMVEARRRLHGPEDRRTLDAMNTYAGLRFERGDTVAARDMMRQVYEARSKLSGPDHPVTLVTAQNLATLLHRTGDVEGAAELMTKVVEGQSRAVGPEHPRTLDATINLSQMRWAQGRTAEAIDLAKRVMDIRKNKLGPEHPETLRAMSNLGNMLSGSKERYAEAEPVLREMLGIAERVLPPDHPQRVLAQIALANTLGRMGRADEADVMFRQGLERSIQSKGADHPVTASFHKSYADFLIKQQRWAEADEHAQQALRVATHPKTANTTQEAFALLKLAQIAEARGDVERAERYRVRLAEIRPKEPGNAAEDQAASTAPASAPASMPVAATAR